MKRQSYLGLIVWEVMKTKHKFTANRRPAAAAQCHSALSNPPVLNGTGQRQLLSSVEQILILPTKTKLIWSCNLTVMAHPLLESTQTGFSMKNEECCITECHMPDKTTPKIMKVFKEALQLKKKRILNCVCVFLNASLKVKTHRWWNHVDNDTEQALWAWSWRWMKTFSPKPLLVLLEILLSL